MIRRICLVVVALVVPRAGQAQGKLELTPFFASYYALTTMSNDISGDGTNVRIRQLSAPTYGGRITYWVSRTIGVEASAGYTTSGLRAFSNATVSGGVSFSFSGNVLLTSARMLYRPARTNLHLIVGGGMVRRGGNFWKDAHASNATKVTSPAAILGAGVRASVTPKFALNVSLEANIYSFDPDGTDTLNKSKLQADVLVAIGIPLTLSR
mgnify:CR=1 FL=1